MIIIKDFNLQIDTMYWENILRFIPGKKSVGFAELEFREF